MVRYCNVSNGVDRNGAAHEILPMPYRGTVWNLLQRNGTRCPIYSVLCFCRWSGWNRIPELVAPHYAHQGRSSISQQICHMHIYGIPGTMSTLAIYLALSCCLFSNWQLTTLTLHGLKSGVPRILVQSVQLVWTTTQYQTHNNSPVGSADRSLCFKIKRTREMGLWDGRFLRVWSSPISIPHYFNALQSNWQLIFITPTEKWEAQCMKPPVRGIVWGRTHRLLLQDCTCQRSPHLPSSELYNFRTTAWFGFSACCFAYLKRACV